MKLFIPELIEPLDLDNGRVQMIIVESPDCLFNLISVIQAQIEGLEGPLVLSENGKSIAFSKSVELITQFFPLDLNQKNLVNRIVANMEKQAMEEKYSKATELLSGIENFLLDLSMEYQCEIDYPKLSIGSILKAAGIEIRSNSTSICEKLLEYMSLVTSLFGKKAFITVNLQCYVSQEDTEELMKTVVEHGFPMIMIEAVERKQGKYEERTIIDRDLCIIR